MNNIMEYYPILVGFVAVVVWSIRLEGKISAQEKEIQAFAQIMSKLSLIAEDVAYLKGSMERGNQ